MNAQSSIQETLVAIVQAGPHTVLSDGQMVPCGDRREEAIRQLALIVLQIYREMESKRGTT
jgi:hypothetical protein